MEEEVEVGLPVHLLSKIFVLKTCRKSFNFQMKETEAKPAEHPVSQSVQGNLLGRNHCVCAEVSITEHLQQRIQC